MASFYLFVTKEEHGGKTTALLSQYSKPPYWGKESIYFVLKNREESLKKALERNGNNKNTRFPYKVINNSLDIYKLSNRILHEGNNFYSPKSVFIDDIHLLDPLILLVVFNLLRRGINVYASANLFIDENNKYPYPFIHSLLSYADVIDYNTTLNIVNKEEENKGRLIVYTGPMGSGKTFNLIRTIKLINSKNNGNNIIVKHSFDVERTRDYFIRTQSRMTAESFKVESKPAKDVKDLERIINDSGEREKLKNISIDEMNFFGWNSKDKGDKNFKFLMEKVDDEKIIKVLSELYNYYSEFFKDLRGKLNNIFSDKFINNFEEEINLLKHYFLLYKRGSDNISRGDKQNKQDSEIFYIKTSPTTRFILNLLNKGVNVYVSGLELAFNGIPFPPTSLLLPFADEIKKYKAVCYHCNKEEATMTVRFSKIDEGNNTLLPADGKEKIIKVGSVGDQYSSSCKGDYPIESFILFNLIQAMEFLVN